jgi:hypothetical protein
VNGKYGHSGAENDNKCSKESELKPRSSGIDSRESSEDIESVLSKQRERYATSSYLKQQRSRGDSLDKELEIRKNQGSSDKYLNVDEKLQDISIYRFFDVDTTFKDFLSI